MLGERITRGKKGNGINPENRRIDEEAQRTQSRKKRNGIHTGGTESTEDTEDTEDTEQKEGTHCLTIEEGRNKLSPCGNSWNDCFKSIF